MRPLEDHLRRSGFEVYNLRYPSTKETTERLVGNLSGQIADCCADAGVLHFVGHSLGGILIRAYLAQDAKDENLARVAKEPRANLGRVVMLGPPNRGSELVDALGDTALFKWALGPAGQELSTDPGSLPNRLPPPSYELGVIAGNRSISLGSLILPAADDGKVSVANTKLEGMTDFVVVATSHTFMMRSDEVGMQVIHFLRHGRFRHEGSE